MYERQTNLILARSHRTGVIHPFGLDYKCSARVYRIRLPEKQQGLHLFSPFFLRLLSLAESSDPCSSGSDVIWTMEKRHFIRS